MNRGLCVAIHDVSPATWPECEKLLDMLAPLGRVPLTLLVVPDYHHAGRIDLSSRFRRGIDARLAQGDEVALHGYWHLDDGRASPGLATWLRRRLLTDGEGEFAALPAAEAEQRIRHGRELLQACGWHAAGFVPPAWLASDGAREALRRTGMQYTSTHSSLLRVADGAAISAPCITASARSPWRRAASRLWLKAAASATSATPLLRLGLHPVDARHPGMAQAWRSLAGQLLADRTPLTKSQALERYSCDARPR